MKAKCEKLGVEFNMFLCACVTDPTSPGGVAYDREYYFPDWLLDTWHPLEKAQYPHYFAQREQRKREFIQRWVEKHGVPSGAHYASLVHEADAEHQDPHKTPSSSHGHGESKHWSVVHRLASSALSSHCTFTSCKRTRVTECKPFEPIGPDRRNKRCTASNVVRRKT